MRIYYLGPVGSYSYILACKMYEKDLISCNSFQEIVNKTKEDIGSLGILPVENSITSNVHENIDLLFDSSHLQIVAEAYLAITLNLIAKVGTSIDEITKVISHSKALEQCLLFIKKHKLESIAAESTSSAQQIVAESEKNDVAAIGSSYLALPEKLAILESDIGDIHDNYTRFIIVSMQKDLPQNANKLTAIFKAKHERGSLASILESIASAGGNLTKIESRPIPGTNWEYEFLVDIEFEEKRQILDTLKDNTIDYRIIGMYQKGGVYFS